MLIILTGVLNAQFLQKKMMPNKGEVCSTHHFGNVPLTQVSAGGVLATVSAVVFLKSH